MAVFCFILSGCCIAYYLGISIYSGYFASFGFFWIGIALIFAVCGGMIIYGRRHDIQLPIGWKIFLRTAITFGLTIFGIIQGILIYHANEKPVERADYLIVLGAKVNGTQPSLILKKRLDAAVSYAVENPQTKIIVSGGQGVDEAVSEAEAMAGYLSAQGISDERIIEENQAVNTKQNISFSKGLMEGENPSVVIVTNGFHVYRGIRLARNNGLENVSGLGAATPAGFHLNSYIREAFALIKDFVVGNIW